MHASRLDCKRLGSALSDVAQRWQLPVPHVSYRSTASWRDTCIESVCANASAQTDNSGDENENLSLRNIETCVTGIFQRHDPLVASEHHVCQWPPPLLDTYCIGVSRVHDPVGMPRDGIWLCTVECCKRCVLLLCESAPGQQYSWIRRLGNDIVRSGKASSVFAGLVCPYAGRRDAVRSQEIARTGWHRPMCNYK